MYASTEYSYRNVQASVSNAQLTNVEEDSYLIWFDLIY
jgi:hypothetical protein